MKKLLLRILILLSITLNVALLIHKNSAPLTGASKEPDGVMSLSARQVDRIQEIRRKDEQRSQELSSRLKSEQNRLVSLLKDTQVDRPRLEECLAQISEIQSEIQRLAVEQILQCRQSMDHQECCCLVDACAKNMSLPDEKNRHVCKIK